MSIKVLIADDSAFLRKAISDILIEDKSLEIVDRASNGLEAIEMVKRYGPDVLILDLLMPKMNGLDAFKHIMADDPTPTLILSSISPKNMDASVQALLLGAFDYVIKPGGLGAKSLPEFRKQLLDKVIAASHSQIKKVYSKRKKIETRGSFRQHLVSETFEFGKYLNRLEPIQDYKVNKERKYGTAERIEEKQIQKESVPNKVHEEDLSKRPIKIKNATSKPKLKAKTEVTIIKPRVIKKESVQKPKIKTIPLKKITRPPSESVKSANKTKTKEGVIKKPIKPIQKEKSREAPVKSSEITKKKTKYVPVTTPVKGVNLTSNIIVMGASVGGPRTIKSVLNMIPQDILSPILVVQHLTPHFVETFAQSLNYSIRLRVKIAEDKEHLKPGVVYIAPGGKHMEISVINKKPCMKTYIGPPVHFCIPSIDVLFYSAARVYGNRTMGILLTGMGEDGVDGLGAIRTEGGRTIAEAQETGVLYGIPKLAAEKGYAGLILPNYKIPDHLTKFAKGH